MDSANRVEKRVVELGVSTANRTEILGGLNAGDKVIVANLSTFQSGETVAPKLSVMSDTSATGEDQ